MVPRRQTRPAGAVAGEVPPRCPVSSSDLSRKSRCGDRVTHVPTGSGDLKTGLLPGLLHGVLRQLGLTIRDLR